MSGAAPGPAQGSSPANAQSGAAKALVADQFDWAQAIGGWRGLLESVAPGVVFVSAFLIWGGFTVPSVAAVGTVAVLVTVRLIQGTAVAQALGGVLGVALGAIWAWRSGEASAYFAPGLWITGGYTVGLVVSMVIRWPAVGVVVGLLRGWSTRWRSHPHAMRRFQQATAFFALTQAIKLAIQLPLFVTDQTAALGVARLALGAPLFAVALYIMWLMVRGVVLPEEPADRPQPKG